ncbi:hypothetical protein [Arcobacter defluvii]|uniref:Uncharacterized protein n=1 Tax=Arcobacter defluvii TaxID=873191 RepID=A0AAE7BGS1_9BACT|nr:hypothetical protein [Arcobacter defluvii]QKF77626.1 hypothetical protein ADFLV_1605 [Arcobacter defluvii]RXI34399.1 hypothetical protein CP964_03320 [Arcobacter defluvii]
MENKLDSCIKNLLENVVSHKDRNSYLENSLIYKIMENQEMCSKESFFSYFEEEGEIFEQIVEEINFEEFQNVKTLLLNCISSSEEVLIDFYANGFLDDLNKFNKESNIHLANVVVRDIDKIFFNLIYQKK